MLKRALAERILEARATAEPGALVLDLSSGQRCLVFAEIVLGDFAPDDDTLGLIRARIDADRSGTVESLGGTELFVQVFAPPPRMIIVGAVHIAQALVPMAQLAGYATIVVDPRRAFASDARFPHTQVRGDWPDDALAALKPDTRTAVVTLTHDPKLDDPALSQALKSPAFYIGALGSRKTHAARLARLHAAGFAEAETARIHGPVGLSIEAVTPPEIAVSILAQITAVRREGAKTGGSKGEHAA
jgi:xanthine dehydrogenase accessory factor